MTNDTIAAIATSPGRAGISIVRISGPDSLRIADRVFRCPLPLPSARAGGSFVYGRVCSPQAGREVDEAILLVYRAPHSYTREDLVELQGHGGGISAQRVLRCVLDSGARMAEPGEFTRRAFLNGRVDLLQAEAVGDLIAAQSDRAAQAAVEQLEGELSDAFGTIYDDLISAAADLEASLDFPEEEGVPTTVVPGAKARILAARTRIDKLLATWGEGRILREGLKVVIVGKPNVGKSSLLNALLGEDRAIVTPIAGTTRDTVEEQIILDGLSVRLVDTAGIRDTSCEIEIEGVRRSMQAASKADLVLHVLDASQELAPETVIDITLVQNSGGLVVANKSDLGIHKDFGAIPTDRMLFCCVLRAEDVVTLKSRLTAILSSMCTSESDHAVISERHRQILLQTDIAASSAAAALDQVEEEGILFASSHLREAIETLGRATGRVYSDELLDQVFSRFCIGK